MDVSKLIETAGLMFAGAMLGSKVAPMLAKIKATPLVSKIGQKAAGTKVVSVPVTSANVLAGLQIADEVIGIANEIPLTEKILAKSIEFKDRASSLATRALFLGEPHLSKLADQAVATVRKAILPFETKILKSIGLGNIAKLEKKSDSNRDQVAKELDK